MRSLLPSLRGTVENIVGGILATLLLSAAARLLSTTLTLPAAFPSVFAVLTFFAMFVSCSTTIAAVRAIRETRGGKVEIEPLDGDDWARIRVRNDGAPMRFQVKVERLVGPPNWTDPYAVPWRERRGDDRQDPWQFLANGDQGIANVADIVTPTQEESDGTRLIEQALVQRYPVRFHSVTHDRGHEDIVLAHETEIRCEIAILRERGSKISRTFLLRVGQRHDPRGGLIPTLTFTQVG